MDATDVIWLLIAGLAGWFSFRFLTLYVADWIERRFIEPRRRRRRCSICHEDFEFDEVLVRVPPDSKYAGMAHWRCFHAYGKELGLDFVFDPWRGVRLRERKE